MNEGFGKKFHRKGDLMKRLFFSARKSGNFLHIWGDSLFNYTEKLEKREKIHWRKFKKFWGRKWVRLFYGRLEFLLSFCRKTSMSIKFLVLGGGILVFWGGGGLYACNRYNVANWRSRRETVHFFGSKMGHFRRFGTTKISSEEFGGQMAHSFYLS